MGAYDFGLGTGQGSNSDTSFINSIKKASKPSYNNLVYNPITMEMEDNTFKELTGTGLQLPDYTNNNTSWYSGLGNNIMSGIQNKDLMSGLGTVTDIGMGLFGLYDYFAGDTHDMNKEKLKGQKLQNDANSLALSQKQKFYDPAQNKLIG